MVGVGGSNPLAPTKSRKPAIEVSMSPVFLCLPKTQAREDENVVRLIRRERIKTGWLATLARRAERKDDVQGRTSVAGDRSRDDCAE